MRRRSYTSIFKKFVIKHYVNSLKHSKRRTSIVFGIIRSCVIDWLKEKDEIMSQKAFSKRKFVESTKVNKALYHDAEGELHKWFEIQHSKQNERINESDASGRFDCVSSIKRVGTKFYETL
jgi:hypothetical protein